MNKDYYGRIVNYFMKCAGEDFDEATLHQVRRCLIDYLGCAIYTTRYGLCGQLVELIRKMGPGEGAGATLWGDSRPLSAPLAAFANAVRTAHIEMDDCSACGAGVHPGVYVFTAALAAAEEHGTSTADFIRAVVLGYEVCMRMGMIAVEQVREFGLHGPGMVGGLASAAAGGLAAGLDEEQMHHAFAITASLLPVCPFVSFIQGSSSKDLYGGWGAFLGMFAVQGAAGGLTGPVGILDGPKSLSSILAGQKGTDLPIGERLLIQDTAFKEFSACHSVHPAMNVLIDLKKEHGIDPAQVAAVMVETYPYSYDLDAGVGPLDALNASSARLSLRFTSAVTIIEGELSPQAFFPKGLQNPAYLTMAEKVMVKKHEEYGDGPFGIRGSIVTVTMQDGTVYSGEQQGAKWSDAPTDEALIQKFRILVSGAMSENEIDALIDRVMHLEEQESPTFIIDALRGVRC